MLSNGIMPPLHALVVGVLSYAALVLILRISGKRTLAKLNAFDFVVTIAIGSVLASAIVSSEVALAEVVVAFSVLVGLQFSVSRLTRAHLGVRRIVTARPVALVLDGRLRCDALRRERVTEDEIRATLRRRGVLDLDTVSAVVLETDGTLSVIAGETGRRGWALEGVRGAEGTADDPSPASDVDGGVR